jgi:DNA-binding GntR family transcriptional regulator
LTANRTDEAELGNGSGEPSSNVDAAYLKLRKAILDGELAAGARLSQVQLASTFDMSRGPLREALRLLERDGLIVTVHQRMVRVSQVSMADLDELYALRIVNESLAVRLAVPVMGEKDFSRLRGRIDDMEAAALVEDWEAWRTSHRDFHVALFSPAGERTAQMLGELFDHADRYRRIYHYRGQDPSTAAAEHREITAACVDGDRELASVRVAQHLARSGLLLCAHGAVDYEPLRIREAWRFVGGVMDPVPLRSARRS